MVSEPQLPEDLSPILRHLEAAYPNEGCGVILRNPTGRWRVQPMRNAYDEYRARDPAGYPRTSRTAYVFDSREQLRVWEMAEAAGEDVACVFHSHTDAGAYFSTEDRAMAAPNGEPLLPGMAYLVVAVDRGKATAVKLFWWDGADFSERSVRVTE
jgi:proteasome lid subunit RPN8/RPN11